MLGMPLARLSARVLKVSPVRLVRCLASLLFCTAFITKPVKISHAPKEAYAKETWLRELVQTGQYYLPP